MKGCLAVLPSASSAECCDTAQGASALVTPDDALDALDGTLLSPDAAVSSFMTS
jgi:hypothetical protein